VFAPQRAVSRFEAISSHDALVLLRSSFSAPKLIHTLRSSSCFGHESLLSFDSLLCKALCKICNVSLSDDQWLQASLPVKSGGLGIRRVASLASSAFLASAVSTHDLQQQILHFNTGLPDDSLETIQQYWQHTHFQYLTTISSKAAVMGQTYCRERVRHAARTST
jgi:hypothetical protein